MVIATERPILWANSIGARNRIYITDMSGSLPAAGAAIAISAWDAGGIAIPESSSATPLTLSSHGTTSIMGSSLASRFPTGVPIAYEFGFASTKYIITNVKSSSNATINIPYVYTNGTTKYATNYVSSRTSFKISDFSGTISEKPLSGGGLVTVNIAAWDADGESIAESGSAVPIALTNNGTATISGSALMAEFPERYACVI